MIFTCTAPIGNIKSSQEALSFNFNSCEPSSFLKTIPICVAVSIWAWVRPK